MPTRAMEVMLRLAPLSLNVDEIAVTTVTGFSAISIYLAECRSNARDHHKRLFISKWITKNSDNEACCELCENY